MRGRAKCILVSCIELSQKYIPLALLSINLLIMLIYDKNCSYKTWVSQLVKEVTQMVQTKYCRTTKAKIATKGKRIHSCTKVLQMCIQGWTLISMIAFPCIIPTLYAR